ncbi:hypothetical protein [uncultured Sphingomonas sp.]|uniref:hypothetical protein n=1 Tax=uncultured Sphingomonas sp. TaxID=158754 RepID=UPI0035CAD1E7
MERDPQDFDQHRANDDVAGMDDAALDAWLEALPLAPGIPSTPEEVAAADARALEDLKAGRVVSHDRVATWLRTWGTPDFKPMPREWLE